MRFNASEKCCAYTMNDHMKDDIWIVVIHAVEGMAFTLWPGSTKNRLIQLCKGIERKAEYVGSTVLMQSIPGIFFVQSDQN